MNGTGEWIVRNMKLGLVCKKKTEKTICKRIEFLDDETCVVLHGKKNLELWNLRENYSDKITFGFDLCDFFIYRD